MWGIYSLPYSQSTKSSLRDEYVALDWSINVDFGTFTGDPGNQGEPSSKDFMNLKLLLILKIKEERHGDESM